jgi:hypothetical protein
MQEGRTTMESESSQATRHNQGKIDFTLLPVDALEAEAKVWMMGEVKYGRDNWHKLWQDQTVTVVMQSLLRHAFAIMKGELIDPESGVHHGAHIRANAAMLIRHHNETKDTITLPEGVKFDGEFWAEEQHEWIQHYDYDPAKPYEYTISVQTGTGKDK